MFSSYQDGRGTGKPPLAPDTALPTPTWFPVRKEKAASRRSMTYYILATERSKHAPRGGRETVKSTKLRPSVLLLAVAVLLLAACSGNVAPQAGSQSAPMPKVVVGASVPVWYVQAPFLVAKAKGFFDEVGLKEFDYKVGGNDLQLVQGVAAGSFDIGLNTGTVTVMKAIEQGGPIKMVAGFVHGANYVVYAKQGTRPADLKGKKIAVATGGDITFAMLKIGLAKAGLDPEKDVTMVPAGSPADRVGALFSGQVDAAINHLALQPVYASRGFMPVINLQELPELKPWVLIAVSVNEKFRKEHPQAVQAFVSAAVKARKWYHDPANKAELKKILTGAGIKIDNDALFDFEFQTDRDTSPDDWALPKDAFDNTVKFAVSAGALNAPVAYEKAVDNSFLAKALKDAGIR